jgi:hypothetical protein
MYIDTDLVMMTLLICARFFILFSCTIYFILFSCIMSISIVIFILVLNCYVN